MKKGTKFLIIAIIMFIIGFTFIIFCFSHPTYSLPLWIPDWLSFSFYGLYTLAVIGFFIAGIEFKILEIIEKK